MKFVLIFGPHAVGKMTVGQELEKITGLKLFHNHMTIELIAPLFGYGSKSPVGTELVKHFRRKIFEEYAKTDNEGLIFTYVWAFDEKEDWDFVDEICAIFEEQGAEIFFVELEADLEKRVERNKTPHRLEHKPSKRDVELTERKLKESAEKYRLNSEVGEIKRENYMRINNTNLEADEVARRIVEGFGF